MQEWWLQPWRLSSKDESWTLRTQFQFGLNRVSRATIHSCVQEMSYKCLNLSVSNYWSRNNTRSILPGLKSLRSGPSFSGPKSSFQMKIICVSFGNQDPRVCKKSGEAKNPSRLKSSVKFSHSAMICGAVSSAGVGPQCFIKSRVNAAIYLETFRAHHASICWQAL